jgi:UDP-glucose 4-epimerase
MNILVTGGNGYIASRLIPQLANNKSDLIYVLSRNVCESKSGNVICLKGDMSKGDFTGVLPEHIDVVLHLAQSSRYREFPEGATDMFNISIHGTFHLLEWAKKAGASRFIFFSTGNVYKQKDAYLTEDDICDPQSFYGASKLCSELLLKQFDSFFQPVILRLFGVYGPGQMRMTIPNLISRVRQKQEVSLAKGVGMYFTPIYIDDCIEFILKIYQAPPEKKGVIYNVSGNEIITIPDVIQIIQDLEDIRPVLKITEQAPLWLQGNNEKLKQATGYSPRISFKNGLSQVLMQKI